MNPTILGLKSGSYITWAYIMIRMNVMMTMMMLASLQNAARLSVDHLVTIC